MSGKVIVLASGAVVLALLVVLAAVAYASWPTCAGSTSDDPIDAANAPAGVSTMRHRT